MYRIIGSKLLVLIRLAIIVSLAGYSLSNASAAMHGRSEFSVRSSVTMVDRHQDVDTSHSHYNPSAKVGSDEGMKTVKQDCCKDFCMGFALVIPSTTIHGPLASTVSGFLNDRGLAGQIPALHRPPNI